MFLILINGPPGSGKTTLGDYISKKYSIPHLEFKRPLIDICKSLLKIDSDLTWNNIYSYKDIPNPHSTFPLNSENLMTPRECLIYTAEKIVKPTLGKNVFVKSVVKQAVNSGSEFAVISDLGFQEEYDYICKKGIPHIVFTLRRTGHNYSKDSRTEIDTHANGVTVFTQHFIRNDSTLDRLYGICTLGIDEFRVECKCKDI